MLPGFVLVFARDARHPPVPVHDRVVLPLLVHRADAKARSALDGPLEEIELQPIGQRPGRHVENGKLHPAGDIDADGVRHHRILQRQHAADRQAVADVGVGHQRGRSGHRQRAGLPHLHVRLGVDAAITPSAIGDGLAHFDRRAGCKHIACELTKVRIEQVVVRTIEDVLDHLLDVQRAQQARLGGVLDRQNRALEAVAGNTKFFQLPSIHKSPSSFPGQGQFTGREGSGVGDIL